MMKRKIIDRILAGQLIMCMFVLGSCTGGQTTATETPTEEPDNTLSVAATFYPIYALASLITDGVEGVSVSCMTVPSDECPRTYTLSDWDSALLANTDIIVLGGHGLESFENALYNMGDDGPALITANYEYPMITPVSITNPDEATAHFTDADPGIYLSVSGAEAMLTTIEAGLSALDPEYETQYLKNLESAKASMETLRTEIEEKAQPVSGQKVIVMAESLEYAAQDLGLTVKATWSREYGQMLYESELNDFIESAQSFDTKVILIEQQAPEALCNALTNAGFTVVKLNAMTSIPASNGAEDWFDAMRTNADAIVKGFE